ncbi:uncharacterized protein DMENIID0001_023860 [Sergentomyia squamirostris]
MKLFLNSTVYLTLLLICCVIWVACSVPVAMSCDSCGRECATACGTRHFRTCCFNYLKRKRTVLPPLRVPEESPSDFRDFWWAKLQMEKAARDNLLNAVDTYGSDFPSGLLLRLPSETQTSLGNHEGRSDENSGIIHKSKLLDETESGQQASRGLYET